MKECALPISHVLKTNQIVENILLCISIIILGP